ncbi:MAG: SusC/RagA family TonB-linked outer membrane protein, partial [Paramuribaculum sp.]|nr:SusC/RagA family TonB-linked outer membrane protein [Paramuribaculum sp.]
TDKSLDEVMVVAYGAVKKSAFTGSATTIDASTIEKAQVTNALSALAGKMPGANMYTQSGAPGKGPTSIVINGFSSLDSSMQPMIVVDGVPYGGSVSDINTNDIESMTMLKDAASTALYGARGANGVILINTKRAKGSSGAVTLDAKWGWNTRGVQDYQLISDPRLYYETYYGALYSYYREQGYTHTNAWRTANANLITNPSMGLGYQVFSYPEGEMFIGQNGKINPNATYGNTVNYNGQEYYLRPDNWLDETYKSSLRQEYNVSVTNSTERTNFMGSFGYLKNEGIIPNTEYSRITGRLAADTQVKSWLKVGGNFAYNHYDTKSMSSDGSSSSTANPLAMATALGPIYPMYLRDGKGNIMKNSDDMIRFDYGDGENAGLRRPGGAFMGANGMSGTLYNTNQTCGNVFNVNGFAEIRFLKDFKFTTNNTVYIDDARTNSVSNPYFGGGSKVGGSVGVAHTRYTEYTYQQLLEWHHLFGKHDVSITAGHENMWQRSTYLDGTKTMMFSPSNPELAGAVIDGSATSYVSEYNNEGWLVRGLYNFNEQYFLDGYYRRDGSSRFHPDHRWGNFWAVGAAWIMSKESWFDAQWVDMLKIKASYGELGNDRIGNYRFTNTYSVVNVGGKPALSASTVKGNPLITWEKVGNFNAGVEFSLFGGRLTGTVDAYYKKTTDMLYQKPLAASTGFSNIYENFGDMVNYGVNVDLQGTIIATRDFTWDINLVLGHVTNEITRLPETNKAKQVDGHWGTGTGGFFNGEGLPLYTYYTAKYAGVDKETGKPMFWGRESADSDTWIKKEAKDVDSETDYQLCGSAVPDLSGGFGTTFRYKGFDLSASFTYQIGGKVTDGNYQSYMGTVKANTQGGAIHADMLNAWTPENPNSDIPRFMFNDDFTVSSDRFLTSASYLNLQNISLGYTLPTSLVSKLTLQKVRLYLTCENVWLWSARQGFDPRTYALGTDTSHALSGGNAYNAAVRTFTGGVTVTF